MATGRSRPASTGEDLLRFITCGSVDDGKSTLIGRLLYDAKVVPEDQLAALKRDGRQLRHHRRRCSDLALLVDGLQAEREQGITIDVAYRFFSTARRKFIVADTPGHEQYTRNMATGASTADLAVMLVDARKGVLHADRRHSGDRGAARHPARRAGRQQDGSRRLSAKAAFRADRGDYRAFAERLGLADGHGHPAVGAARRQCHRAERTPCPGTTARRCSSISRTSSARRSRRRGLSACRCNGSTAPTRIFAAMPAPSRAAASGQAMIVVAALGPREPCRAHRDRTTATSTAAVAGQAVTLTLADEIDVARGDLHCRRDRPPHVADQFAAHLVWMHESRCCRAAPICCARHAPR